MIEQETWDVVVIGGGPAGLMAAGTAGAQGKRVLVLEKNSTPGRKLLMSGGGRCNFTNANFDNHGLAGLYGQNGPCLLSPFSRFSAQDALKFFESRGMAYKIEDNLRAFPASDKAQSVLTVLMNYINENNVHLRCHEIVKGFEAEHGIIVGVRTGTGLVKAKSFILATGGTSHPETGSTGDGYRWLKALGHQVKVPQPSLVPTAVKEPWIDELQGLSFQELRVGVFQGGKKHLSRIGKVLFTHFGLSGPLILNLSSEIQRLSQTGQVTLSLDFFPKEDHGALDRRLLEIFAQGPNRKLKNALDEMVPPRLVSRWLILAGADPELTLNKLPKAHRGALVNVIKDFPLTFKKLLGEEWAVVTSGGVSPKEVDFKTMGSRLFSNLFLAGDILDFDRPSGGYSLQVCWATGYTAGLSASLT